MATTADDVWRLLGELTEAQKETERQLQETKQILQEETTATRQLLRQRNEQFNQQVGKLGNRLGEFVEWQVRPAVARLLQERGIAVHELYPGASARRDDKAIKTDTRFTPQHW
jgi:hypothetical protein